MATIKTLVTYLEMCQQSSHPLPLLPPDIHLKLVPNIDISDYKALYSEIGQNYCWTSRLLLTDDELSKIIHHSNVQIFHLIENDKPIGWCNANNRLNYQRLLKDYDYIDNPDDKVCSIVCFFYREHFLSFS